jgi:LacI family transcriptional regulator
LRQIAKLAGVSAMTVSRALRDDPYVRAETKQRVMEIAELFHYRPNRLVQSLTTGRSHAIGAVVPVVSSAFYSWVLQGITERAYEESFYVITLQTHHQLVHARRALQMFIEQRVEGVLLALGFFDPLPREAILELWSHGIVPVEIDAHHLNTTIDRVMTDEDQVAELALDHLHELGHRNIRFLDAYSPGAGRTLRGQAFARAFQRREGITGSVYALTPDYQPSQIVQTWCAEQTLPTALVTYTDVIGAEFIRALRQLGIAVPEDVSVIGCGNIRHAEFMTPPLTSVDQRQEAMGRAAFDLLLKRLEAGTSPAEITPEVVLMPPRLVVRESCVSPSITSPSTHPAPTPLSGPG